MPNHHTTGSSPKSDSIRARIVDDVRHGRFAGHDVLPGERDFASTLGVSRTTLRRALADLVGSGFLGRRQGYGTFVRHPETEQPQSVGDKPLPATRGPGDELLASGAASMSTDNTIGLFRPLADEAMALHLASGARIWRAARTLVDNEGTPFAWERIAVAEISSASTPVSADDLLASLERQGIVICRHRRRMRFIGGSDGMQGRVAKEWTSGIVTEQHGFSADERPCIVWRLVQSPRSFDIVVDTATLG